MTAMTLEQTQQNFPLDLSGLDNVTDPSEYDRIMHQAIQSQLQNGGLVGPTKNITNFQTDSSQDTPSFLEEMGETIFGMSPEVYDSSNKKAVGNYMQGRFDFIVGHEDYREKVYKDSLGKRTIGYGFNLDEPTNRGLFKKVLAKTDAEFDAALNGTASLSAADSRILFEASAGQAERLITQKFGDIPLKGYQRTALVSLAYNHPNLIGPNLTKAIRSGDLKAAEHEIRNRSNKYKIAGIDNRRNLEADMFLGHGNDSGNNMFAKMFAPNTAQANTNTNMQTSLSAPEPDQSSIFDFVKPAFEAISDRYEKLKVLPEPAELLGLALTPFIQNSATYRKSEMASSTQSVLHEVIATADKQGVTQIPYDFYPQLANGLSAKAMLGDASRWDAKKKDWVRHTSGKKKGEVKYFEEDRKKYAAQRNEVYGELNLNSMVSMMIDMQTDPVFRAVGTIGQFSIQKNKNGRFIRERFNFNSYSKSMGDAYASLRTIMGKLGVSETEDEGPLVVFPIDGAVSEDELLGKNI